MVNVHESIAGNQDFINATSKFWCKVLFSSARTCKSTWMLDLGIIQFLFVP
jgi:hypothetical protein